MNAGLFMLVPNALFRLVLQEIGFSLSQNDLITDILFLYLQLIHSLFFPYNVQQKYPISPNPSFIIFNKHKTKFTNCCSFHFTWNHFLCKEKIL